jgi:type IV pilus assembly protein PilY1
MVFVGTGSYLGASDLTDTNQQSPNLQSFYGIRDALSDTGWGDIRGTNIVQQVLTTSGSTRTGTNNPVDLTAKAGWYVDLPDNGERDNTDSALALGTIVFNTNVPDASACTIGGYSWQYQLDYRSGAPIVIPTGGGQGIAANKLGNALATRPVLVELPNNTVVSLTKLSDTTTQVTSVNLSSAGATARRVTWRELITE